MENKLGCTTVGYLNLPFERALQGISRAGLEYVELGAIPGYSEHALPERLDSSGRRALRSLVRKHGLTAVALSGHCDLTTREGLGHLKMCIVLAHELDIPTVNTNTVPLDSPEKERSFYASIAELANEAEAYRVTIGLEDDYLVFSPIEKLKRIGSPWLGINLDPANLIYWMDQRPEDTIRDIAPYMVHMHVKDKRGGRGVYDFPPVGEGDIDFGLLIRALRAAHYKGAFVFEPELHRQEDMTPEQIAETLRDPFAAYSDAHQNYRGVHDPSIVDKELAVSLANFSPLVS
jgi:sugar phosphate isomerase/epimerase